MSTEIRAAQAGEGITMLLLGRPCVLWHGREVALKTRKSLALVAYLALEGCTRRSHLAELLWTELDPSRGRANLRREVYRLRDTPIWTLLEVGDEQLGFRDPVRTDLTDFREHINAHLIREALALCRGSLLEGMDLGGAGAYEEWLTAQRTLQMAEFQSTLEQHARALELGGDLRGALEAQLRLLRTDELQEHAHAEVMRLHALLGERGQALRHFEQLRAVLAEQLGLEPLPETVALAAQMRTSSVPQRLKEVSPAPLLVIPLVGREAVWNALACSNTSVCLILSEPGLGKTRLALDFAHSRASSVLIQGREVSSHTPLSSLAEALRKAHTDPQARARLETLESVWQREVAWLIPELDPTDNAVAPTPEGRDRFLQGLAQALAAAAGASGTVIFDDFQWCDGSTVEVALHLARLASPRDVRILITARTTELESNPTAAGVLALLEHEGELTRFELEPLSALEVLALVRSLSGGMQAQMFSQRLHQATGGNPLYLLETLRSLFASGLLCVGSEGWATPFDTDTDDYTELPLAPSVREAVLLRVDALGGAARRLLELASLAGNGFELEWLSGASALTEWEQLEALERALAVHLIAPLGRGYGFSHDLVRRALEGSIGEDRRVLSHRKLAENLERKGGFPGQIAEHFERAGQSVRAITHRVRAAEEAAHVFAHPEALQQYQCALNDGAEGDQAIFIRLDRATLLSTTSDYPAAEAELVQAAELAGAANNLQMKARVTVAEVGLHNTLGRYEEALHLSAELLEQVALPIELRVQALYQRGAALLRLGRLEEAEPCLHLVLGQSPPDAFALIGGANIHLLGCAMQRGHLRLAQTYNSAALVAFRRAGNRVGAVKALGSSGLLAGLLGDAPRAVQLLEVALLEARELGEVAVQRTLLLNLFKFLLEAGDLEAAVTRLESGLALARDPQDPYLEGVFLNNLGVVHRLRGDLGAALMVVLAALELADRSGNVPQQVRRRLTLAESYLDLSNPEGAWSLLEEARRRSEPLGLGEVHAWHENLLARCELARGQPQRALKRLQSLLGSELPLDLEDRARTDWLVGLAYLAQGRPQQALDQVKALELPREPLLRGWLLSIRLEARTRLGQEAHQDTAEAEILLASGQLYPLESLSLKRALMRTLTTLAETERALVHARALQKCIRHLADSLGDFAALQNSFLEHQIGFDNPLPS